MCLQCGQKRQEVSGERQTTYAGVILEGDLVVIENRALPYHIGEREVRFMLLQWNLPFRKECFVQDGNLIRTGLHIILPGRMVNYGEVHQVLRLV